MRVLASPATSDPDGNAYVRMLYDAVRRRDVEVTAWSRRRALLGRWDAVHVNWPEFLVNRSGRTRLLTSALCTLLALGIARARGARLVWTVHNLDPHDRGSDALLRWYLRRFERRCDRLVFMADAARATVVSARPALGVKPYVVARHGHYRDAHPAPATDVAGARSQLHVPEASVVLLSFGLVRPYKRPEALLSAFRSTADVDAALVIAGNARDAELADRLRERAAGDERVVLHLQRVAGDDIGLWMQAADVVVQPYSILSSGAVLLALSFARPVVVPRSPVHEELRTLVGHRWVHVFDGDLDEAVRMAQKVRRPEGCPDLKAFEWDEAARAVVRAYGEPASDFAR